MNIESRNATVLGTEWSIEFKERKADENLANCDGYCDETSKEIVVAIIEYQQGTVKNIDAYMKKVLRHELVHAFFYESGLGENVEHKSIGVDETTVDWIAFQFPKMLQTFKEAECL